MAQYMPVKHHPCAYKMLCRVDHTSSSSIVLNKRPPTDKLIELLVSLFPAEISVTDKY